MPGKRSKAVAVVVFALLPVQIGRQDLAALITQQPTVAERARAHLITSPFGTIHAALLTFPRPTGSQIDQPLGFRLANLDPTGLDVTGSISARSLVDARALERATPDVDRTHKGDRLVPRVPAQPGPQTDSANGAEARPARSGGAFALASLPSVPVDLGGEPRDKSGGQDDAELAAAVASVSTDPDSGLPGDNGPAMDTARIYFGIESLGTRGRMQPWTPGEGSLIEVPDVAEAIAPPVAARQPGETIATKGEVTGSDQRPMSPAERLGLNANTRPKQEKCLADAVYFEARGESVRGQIAVAQVVMNRVFSGYYPDSVCGVVYQNAHRHLACQFTFACDGIPERVGEPEAWTRARQIARGMLDGKLWLSDVGKATHYHAYWVHPWWVRTMRKLDKIGVHTFYRPRRWGDGADAPTWGDAAETTEAVNKL